MFDRHNFDDQSLNDDQDEEEPPLPTFSAEELEAAKRQSAEQGRRAGLSEAETSREKEVAALLQTITEQFQTLFVAEQERSAFFEQETVELCKAIFTGLFPVLNEKQGLEEVENVIRQTLADHSEKPHMTIEVQPDYAEPVQALIDKAFPNISAKGTCEVIGNDSLGNGACRLAWKDGGGSRDPQKMAEEIMKRLDVGLAEKPSNLDNGLKGQKNETSAQLENGE